jgi:hypothetical protein
MFLISIFTGQYNSNAEEFLFSNCLVGELIKLNEGFIVTIKKQKYFLQARLIQHLWDTKAAEKILKCQCSNSYVGCIFCSGIKGQFMTEFDTMIFPGHRVFLEYDHFLRKFGQSQNCCKADYYKTNLGTLKRFELNEAVFYKTTNKSKNIFWNTGTIDNIAASDCNDDNNIVYGVKDDVTSKIRKRKLHVLKKKINLQNVIYKMKDIVLVNYNDSGNWYQGEITSVNTKQNTYSIDFKDKDKQADIPSRNIHKYINIEINSIKVKNNQKTDELVKKCTLATIQNSICHKKISFKQLEQIFQTKRINNKIGFFNETWHHNTVKYNTFSKHLFYEHCDFRKQIDYVRKTKKAYVNFGLEAIKIGEAVEGVKGLWYFQKLSYANFSTDVNWDGFHSIANISKQFIEYSKGDHGYSEGIKSFCERTMCHPKIYTADNAVLDMPWVFSKEDKLNVDAFLNAILVPVGIKKLLQIDSIFLSNSFIRGIAHIQIVSTLMMFIISATQLNKAYIAYYKMLSDDIISLLRTAFVGPSELDELFLQIAETLALKEGLLPLSEASMISHQLIDFAKYIMNSGPLRNWWTFPGERALNAIKRFVKTSGGSYYELTALFKYFEFENQKIKDTYNFNASNIHLFPSVLQGEPLVHDKNNNNNNNNNNNDNNNNTLVKYFRIE